MCWRRLVHCRSIRPMMHRSCLGVRVRAAAAAAALLLLVAEPAHADEWFDHDAELSQDDLAVRSGTRSGNTMHGSPRISPSEFGRFHQSERRAPPSIQCPDGIWIQLA